MRKILMLVGLYVLFGCTSQLDARYTIMLKNACDYPIDVSVPKYVEHFVRGQIVTENHLDPGEKMIVMAIYCADVSGFFTIKTSSWASSTMCLPDDYKLTITAEDKERSLDKQQLLNTIKRAEYNGKSVYYDWTISNPSLCPK
jgi:hypothetical protein